MFFGLENQVSCFTLLTRWECTQATKTVCPRSHPCIELDFQRYFFVFLLRTHLYHEFRNDTSLGTQRKMNSEECCIGAILRFSWNERYLSMMYRNAQILAWNYAIFVVVCEQDCSYLPPCFFCACALKYIALACGRQFIWVTAMISWIWFYQLHYFQRTHASVKELVFCCLRRARGRGIHSILHSTLYICPQPVSGDRLHILLCNGFVNSKIFETCAYGKLDFHGTPQSWPGRLTASDGRFQRAWF